MQVLEQLAKLGRDRRFSSTGRPGEGVRRGYKACASLCTRSTSFHRERYTHTDSYSVNCMRSTCCHTHTHAQREGGRERERERDRERDRLLPCKHHMTVCEEICGVLAIRLCSDDERFQLRQDLSDVLNIVELGEAIADVIRRI